MHCIDQHYNEQFFIGGKPKNTISINLNFKTFQKFLWSINKLKVEMKTNIQGDENTFR